MNVSRGEIAYIKGLVVDTKLNGLFCEVLQGPLSPSDDAVGPDGFVYICTTGNTSWIVGVTGNHFEYPDAGGNGQYARIDDKNLRPIRDPGEDAQDELLRPLPQPVKEVV